MTHTEEWLYKDAVIFDIPVDEIISALLSEGHTIESAINIIESTQNIKILNDASDESRSVGSNEAKKKKCDFMSHATELPCRVYNNNCNECPWYR